MIIKTLKSRAPISSAKITQDMSDAEVFQNAVLRPIIKMQHELLMSYTKNYISTKKIKYRAMNTEARGQFLENAFQKDSQFKHELKGMITGHFTISEYELYIKLGNEVNKRIINMVSERIIGNSDELVH